MTQTESRSRSVAPGDLVANLLGSIGEVLSVWTNAAGDLMAAVRWSDGTTDPVHLYNLRRL